MMKSAIILLAALVAVQAYPQIVGLNSFDNCGETNPLVLTSLTISPDPIVVPGPATFSTSISGSVGVTSPTPGQFTVSYLNDGVWEDVPCNSDGPIPFGSCPYDDVCTILNIAFPVNQTCPSGFVDGNCHCPFAAGTTNVTDTTIYINNTLSILKDGTYSVRLELWSDTDKTQKIGCIDIEADLLHAA